MGNLLSQTAVLFGLSLSTLGIVSVTFTFFAHSESHNA